MKRIILSVLLSLLLSQRLVFAQDSQVIRLGQAMTTAGDMILNNTRAQPARLPIGTAGQVLAVGSSGLPEWSSSGITLTNPTISGNLTFSSASAKIIPGATDLTIRNNADNANNLYINDAGLLSIRNNLNFTGTSFFIYPNSADAADNRTVNIASGGSASSTRGGYQSLYGNEVATVGGGIDLVAGATTTGHIRLYTTNATPEIQFFTNSLQRWSVDGSGNISQNATNGNDIVFGKDFSSVRAATADAGDNIEVCIAGGGACSVTRGAILSLGGNEQSGGVRDNGAFVLSAGTSGGNMTLQGYSDLIISTGISGPGTSTSWTFDATGTSTNLVQNATYGGSIVMTKASTSVAQTTLTGITAAGTTIADATQLTSVVNSVSTAAAGTGVKLWDATVGSVITVQNFGANDLELYPHIAGSSINAAAAGAGITLAAATDQMAICTKITSTFWGCLVGAGPAT